MPPPTATATVVKAPRAVVPRLDRYTYSLHLRGAVLEGVLNGVLVTNDIVATKALGAGTLFLVALTMAPAACQLLALALSNRVVSTDQRKLFLWAGVFGRLVLLGVAFVHGPGLFLALLIMQAACQTVVIPAQNVIYQANYTPSYRGRLFGRATTFGGLATAATALCVGAVLQHGAEAFRWVYPVAGVMGFLSCLAFGRIRVRRIEHKTTLRSGDLTFASTPEVAAGLRKKGPLATVLEVLAHDAKFRRFEVGFLLYGCGFMAMQPVIAQWIVREIGAGYWTASAAKGLTFYAALVPATALAGRLFDRIGVAALAGGAMVLLAIFALWAATIREAWMLFPAFALFGFAMAGINVTWTIGPIRFAGHHSAALYMAVHVALVGVRALVGNPTGGLLYQTTGTSSWTFVFAACCFLAGAGVMNSLRRHDRHERQLSQHAP